MNEPRHIEEVMTRRMLEARVRVVTLIIDELEQEKAARTLIEETINLRNELIKALENLQSTE